jgi:hypothetical protein
MTAGRPAMNRESARAAHLSFTAAKIASFQQAAVIYRNEIMFFLFDLSFKSR